MTTSIERLWPDAVPGAAGNDPADVPTLTIHRPPEPDGSSIIICPGGGYVFHAEYEADPVAAWLAGLGVTGIVLRYRLAPRYRHPAAYQDACRAARLVRARSGDWGLDATRIGVMGFSAGGHLAALLATASDDAAGLHPSAADPVERLESRPALCVLLYPVITLTRASSHTKSAENLLGRSASPSDVDELSAERRVTARCPATFLYHATGDPNVPVINALLYAEALRAAGVPFEAHLYDRVAHGVGLAAADPLLGTWPSLCARWLRGKGFGRF